MTLTTYSSTAVVQFSSKHRFLDTADECLVAVNAGISIQRHDDPTIFNVLRLREAIKSIRHGNELLKSDLAWEARESRFITNPSAAAEIQKLQDQADIYAKKTEQVCLEKTLLQIADASIILVR